MKNRLKFLLLIIFTFIAAAILSAETDLAKYNLQLAYDSYLDGRNETAKSLAEKARSYDSTLPEYYYLVNLMTDDSEATVSQKVTNSLNVMKYLDNHFFIAELVLLRHAAANIYDVQTLDNIYRRILTYNEADDWLRYIDLLLRTHRYNEALSAIRRIETTVNTIVLKADEVLARINVGGYDFREFTRDILTLRSNRYNPSAVLLYRALYTQELPSEIIEDYHRMSENGTIDAKYRLPILQAILNNKTLQTPVEPVSEYFDIEELDESEQADYADTSNDNAIIDILTEWAAHGGLQNVYTDTILNIDEYKRLIDGSDILTERYMRYSGMRLTDNDDNNIWECRVIYQNGTIVSQEYDANQDGITERKFVYNTENGNLKQVVLQNEKTRRDFTINSGDQSVVECRDSENVGSRADYLITFMKSSYVLSNNVPFESQLTPNVYRKYIESVEYLKNDNQTDDYIHSKEVYDKGVNVITYIDEDNNGVFDRQIIYKNGKVADTLRDLNEDGYYEVRDIYKENKYIGTECRMSEFDKHHYYSEMMSGKNVTKRWDYDDDGNADAALTEPLEHHSVKDKQGKWTIISARDPNLVRLPEDIVITDSDHNSGYYVHKNKKLIFRDGRLTDAPYNLEVRVVGNQIYLFDLQ